MLKKFNLNFYTVFLDEPPISDYPLWIIKRQIAALLAQCIAKNTITQFGPSSQIGNISQMGNVMPN